MIVVSINGMKMVKFENCLWECESIDGTNGKIIATYNGEKIEMLYGSSFDYVYRRYKNMLKAYKRRHRIHKI